MPRLSADKNPRYRLHRPSGQAVVTLSGEDHYLCPYNSKPSRELYNRKLAEWYAAGRAALRSRDAHDITVSELCNAYRKFAEGYYVKNGKQTATVFRVKAMIKFLRAGYATKLFLLKRMHASTCEHEQWNHAFPFPLVQTHIAGN
jgi:hypothetical protein